jgi:hypothetical protein
VDEALGQNLFQGLCLPTAPLLPVQEKRDFGKSQFYGQLSDKCCLP